MISIRTSTGRERFSRRALLKRMGLGAAFLPLLDAEPAPGATAAGVVKRLVTITWTNGMPSTSFWPSSETNPTGSEVLKPLAPLASKVLVAGGLDIKVMFDAGRKFDGHFSYPTLWTGSYRNIGGQFCTSTGPSLDQAYADFVARQVNLPVPVMSITVAGTGQYSGHTSRRNDGNINTPETEPARLFQRALSGASMSPEQAGALRLRRKSVLDFVSRDLQKFAGRLGAQDRGKIDAHLEAVRQLELQLTASSTKSCQGGTAPTGSDYPARLKAFLDVVAMAIRCDVTRSVAVVWGGDGGGPPNSFPFLGINSAYHALAHAGPSAYGQKTRIDNWYYTQVAYLAQQLEATVELGGTALDHSVIGVTTNMNEGWRHYNGRIPFVLVGRAGGTLKTGRVVKLGSWARRSGAYWDGDSGVPNNKLLATLANALGMPVQGFGAGYAGALPELRV